MTFFYFLDTSVTVSLPRQIVNKNIFTLIEILYLPNIF